MLLIRCVDRVVTFTPGCIFSTFNASCDATPASDLVCSQVVVTYAAFCVGVLLQLMCMSSRTAPNVYVSLCSPPLIPWNSFSRSLSKVRSLRLFCVAFDALLQPCYWSSHISVRCTYLMWRSIVMVLLGMSAESRRALKGAVRGTIKALVPFSLDQFYNNKDLALTGDLLKFVFKVQIDVDKYVDSFSSRAW